MQTSIVQSNPLNPSEPSDEVIDFLLQKAVEQYERTTISMYAQQMANIKTYLWTANLILTGAVYILIQGRQYWSQVEINFVCLGLMVTVLSCLMAIGTTLSCLLTGFKRPIVDFPAWQNYFTSLEKYTKGSESESKRMFKQALLSRYNEAIDNGNNYISQNGSKLYFANIMLAIGIGAAFLSLLFFIPYFSIGGL